tara:strand:+ start:45 stop:578 length:534 start_codon:yes stop_codon:yes gene_type:complete
MQNKVSPFDRPIPGQSLTGEPRNFPWENPPEMADIEDVTKYYIEKLADPEIVNDIGALCQAGLPLKPVVNSIVTAGNMKGMHTVDAGMLVAPIIHQFLKQAVKATGIDVKDDSMDYQKEAEKNEFDRFQMLALKYLDENPEEGDPGKEMLKELVEEQPEEEVTPPEEKKPMGLMARG